MSSEEVDHVIELYEGINECTPKQPWGCWEEGSVDYEGKIMRLTDMLGRGVEINIDSGEIKTSKWRGTCEMP